MQPEEWHKIIDFKKEGNPPLLEGSVKSIAFEGKQICVALYNGNYFAFDDFCPHAGAKFSAGGWCDNGKIVCPVHRHKFDLINGRGNMGDYIPTYPTVIKSDGVYIGHSKKVSFWRRVFSS